MSLLRNPGPTEGKEKRETSVAFVLPGLGVVRRGAEAFVGDLARALLDRGFEVTAYCRGEPPAGIPHRRIRALPRDQPWVRRLYGASRLGRKVLDTLFLDPLSLEWYTAALWALPGLWRQRPDVVVMEGGLVGAWVARLLRGFRGAAFVDVAHGLDPKWEGAFARQKPDATVVFTHTARAMLERLAPGGRIEVIPHGVDLDRFHPDVAPAPLPLPGPVVLTVGEVDAHKRMDLTVRALEDLERRGRRASLLVLGDGPEAADLDRLAGELLPPGRYLRRKVERSELPSFYAAADVFTLPSISESFGLVYVEALACGTPVVAPDDPLRREVVGEAGEYCRVQDAESYGRALERALDRTLTRTAVQRTTDLSQERCPEPWGDLPRRRAEGFSFTATVDAYAELLGRLGREGTGGNRR